MSVKLPISGGVIAKNEGDRIDRCVRSLVEVCAEVVVIDSGSSDDTVAKARAAGARVEHQDWLGFAAQKNFLLTRINQPWALMIDADEWLGEGAADALRELFASGRIENADIWRLERRTHFLGKTFRFGGWSREPVGRLFRSDIRYQLLQVHEKHDASGRRRARVRARLEHDTARSYDEYRGKLERYARLFAEQKYGEGLRASALAPLTHALAYALKNGLLRGGFLDGPKAWRYHYLHTRYVWQKYRHLRALQRKQPA